MSANNKQVGGQHYAKGGEFQHWDLISFNFGPSYLIGCATKYITRWRDKNGIQDLQKALHYIEKLQELTLRGVIHPGDFPVPLFMSEFLEGYGLKGTPEAEAVQLLMRFTDAKALQRAWEIVDGMIKEA